MKKILIAILAVIATTSIKAQNLKLKIIEINKTFASECICYKSTNNFKSDSINIDKAFINYIKFDTTANLGILNISLNINDFGSYIFNQVSMQKLQSNNSLIYYSVDENLDKLNTRIYIKIYKDILLRNKFQITIEENCNSNSKWVSEIDCFIQNIESFQPKEEQSIQNDIVIQTYDNKNFSSNYTPGELLYQSAKLKNMALTVGLTTGIVGGIMSGCSMLINHPALLWVPGIIIAGAGSIMAISINFTANKLEKEAGLKMTQIKIKANGIEVNF